MVTFSPLLSVAAIVAFAVAKCNADCLVGSSPSISFSYNPPPSDSTSYDTPPLSYNWTVGSMPSQAAICVPQGEGSWTFALVDYQWYGDYSGYNQQNAYMIMDNTCTIRGLYPQPQCGNPSIQENFLTETLEVLDAGTKARNIYVTFAYGAQTGISSKAKDECACAKITGSYVTDEGYGTYLSACRCAFNQNGQLSPSKRSVGGGSAMRI